VHAHRALERRQQQGAKVGTDARERRRGRVRLVENALHKAQVVDAREQLPQRSVKLDGPAHEPAAEVERRLAVLRALPAARLERASTNTTTSTSSSSSSNSSRRAGRGPGRKECFELGDCVEPALPRQLQQPEREAIRLALLPRSSRCLGVKLRGPPAEEGLPEHRLVQPAHPPEVPDGRERVRQRRG
jgi:hypothetical protein